MQGQRGKKKGEKREKEEELYDANDTEIVSSIFVSMDSSILASARRGAIVEHIKHGNDSFLWRSNREKLREKQVIL